MCNKLSSANNILLGAVCIKCECSQVAYRSNMLSAVSMCNGSDSKCTHRNSTTQCLSSDIAMCEWSDGAKSIQTCRCGSDVGIYRYCHVVYLDSQVIIVYTTPCPEYRCKRNRATETTRARPGRDGHSTRAWHFQFKTLDIQM